MNRRVLLLIVGSLLLPLGCAPTGPVVPLVLEPSELCSDHTDAAIATFEDATLEAAIRAALSVGAQEPLTCGLISGVTGLGGRAPPTGITSLVGIQNLTSLTFFDLFGNSITELGAMSGLTSLTFLKLFNNPNLADISALSGLTSLTFVDVRFTKVTCTDVAALRATGVSVFANCP